MRYLTKLLPSLGLLLIATCLLAARATAQEAKVLKLIGTGATVTLPGGAPVALTEGMSVAKGATINSGAAEVYLEPVTGAIAVIKKNSQVLVEELSGNNPILDLKSGDMVSQLDQSRLAGKTYGVRTPRGVAAARGTTYTVQVSGQTYTVMSQNGTVTITPPPGGGAAITIGAGGVSMSNVNNGAALTPTEMTANSAAIAEAASIAVSAIAVVAANTSGTFSSASATAAGNELTAALQTVANVAPTAMSQVVASASAAAPSQADEMVTTVINQASASGKTPAEVAAAATSVTQAAAQGAASTATRGQDAATITQGISQAAAAAVKGTGMTGDQLATASASIIQAATTGGIQGAAQAGFSGQGVVNQIGVAASTGATAGSGVAVVMPNVNVTVPEAPTSVVTPINPDSVQVVSPSN